ncbi:hypothetical protein CSV75_02665 [Sporosarcina sp. P18a]|nr:hypothetical protein CSV75_02665 [Sporosarcina sp. P18a]
MIIGYARVSSKDQNLARQVKALEEIGCDRIFSEKQSGKNFTFAPSIFRYFRIKYRKNGLFPCLIRKRIIYIEVNHHKID